VTKTAIPNMSRPHCPINKYQKAGVSLPSLTAATGSSHLDADRIQAEEAGGVRNARNLSGGNFFLAGIAGRSKGRDEHFDAASFNPRMQFTIRRLRVAFLDFVSTSGLLCPKTNLKNLLTACL